jgi:PAS domain S-box-containing protein
MRILFAGTKLDLKALASQIEELLPEFTGVSVTAVDDLIEALRTDVFDALVLEDTLYFDEAVAAVVRESATVSLVLFSSTPRDDIDPSDEFVIVSDENAISGEVAIRLSHAVRRQGEVERLLQRTEIASQAVQDIVYRLDDSGKFTYLNSSISQLGYDETELIGKHFTELLDEQTASQASRELVLPAFQGMATAEPPKLFDERRRGARCTRELSVMLKPSGGDTDETLLGYVTASGDVVTHSDGTSQVVGTIGVIRNASKLRDSIDLLRKLYAVADSSQVGILVTDPQMRVQYANPSFYRMSELNPGDVLGNGVSDIAAEGFDVPLQEELSYACSAEVVIEREYSVLGYNGDPVHRIITGRPVYDGERVCQGVVLVVHPAGIRDDLNLPDSVGAIIDRGVNAFRRESGGSAEISVSVPDPLMSIHSKPANLLFSAVRDLLILSSLVTDGGSVRIEVTPSTTSIRVQLSGKKGPEQAPRSASISGRMQAAVARSEILRGQLREIDGDWSVERSDGSIEFTLVIPIASGTRSLPSSAYHLDDFVQNYAENPAVLEEILRLFAEEAPERLRAIEVGLARGDFKEIADAAHSLANTCGTLQSDAGTAAARELEAAARADDGSGCSNALSRLSPAVESVLDAIRQYKSSSGQ